MENGTPTLQPALSSAPPPVVYDYLDYRKFLAEWLTFKKHVQPHYSSTIFCRKAGVSSHSLLGMVIRGERNLSAETSRGFSRAIELTGTAALFFERLVLFNQAKRPEDKFYYLQQMHQAMPSNQQGGTALKLLKDYSDYLSAIENVLIRELVNIEGFKPQADWISRRLKNRFPKNRCERAWALLVRLGMVRQDERGKWIQTDPNLLVEASAKAPALSRFQIELFEFATESVRKEPLEDRDLGSLTISIPREDLPLLKKKMQEFRRELHKTFPVSQGPRDEVVIVGLQMFRTTAPAETPVAPEGESS